MKRIVAILMFAITALAVPAAAPVYAQGTGAAPSLEIPITGTVPGGAFVGTFSLRRFVRTATGVDAVGILTGTLTNAAGQTTSIVRAIRVPVAAITQATCDILHLDLGPLSLDLLGLQVDLSRIVLDITAESGPGNLLGNLLCAVAGLLDNPSGLARILNQILGIIA
jgi:hypothetical protein